MSQFEFVYKRIVNQSIRKRLFEIDHTCCLCRVFIDLVVLPTTTGGSQAADNVVEKPEQIHAKIKLT